MTDYFISDLHLCAERPHGIELFVDFLHRLGRGPKQDQRLYILGDLFETWIGDDAPSPEDQRVMAELGELAASGRRIYVMHGNRDFLLGGEYLRRHGCLPLPDPTVADLHGARTLLMHGDTLCTDDLDYQALRSRIRTPRWRRETLGRPVAERRALAAEYRRRSVERTDGKQESIMDVNDQAVRAVMRAHRVSRLIHGHTHRPGIHRFELDGQPVRRYVLGAWYEHGSVLECGVAGCRLTT